MKTQIKIHVRDKENRVKEIYAAQGSTLFDVLIQNGISFKGNCGKKRACNACMVYFEKEQEWKKSCSVRLTEDISIQISGLLEEEGLVLLEQSKNKKYAQTKEKTHSQETGSLKESYELSVDLGTTTIAFLLFDPSTGETIDQFGILNPQRIHGADVASRIAYGGDEEKVKDLKSLFEEALIKALVHFEPHLGEKAEALKRIGIAGNTVMMHILQEFPLTSLGSYPFTTNNTEKVSFFGNQFFLGELKSRLSEVEILLSPCSTAYIGGDVLVGAVSEGFDLSEEVSLFLDLGTNGEMILGKKGRFLSASTAAGPAFEGSFRTQHIHGTRLIDFLVMARRQKWMNESGTICDRFFEKGIPYEAGTYLTQEVIRSLQLAKSAIYSGILLLCDSYGITPDEVDKVYIAGGFGFYLKLSSAVFIKMFPPSFEGKVQVVGNSSLTGMRQYMSGTLEDRMEAFRASITNIELANLKEFQECYVKYLNF